MKGKVGLKRESVGMGLLLLAGFGCAAANEGPPIGAAPNNSSVTPPGSSSSGMAGSGMQAMPGGMTGIPNNNTGPNVTPDKTPGNTPSGTVTPSIGTPMPCGVAAAVKNNCQSCHGKSLIGGAPMSLVTYDDFHAQAKTKPNLKVFELAKMRLNDKAAPMPPGSTISAADFSALDTWLAAGAAAGGEADKSCTNTPPPTVVVPDGGYGAIDPVPGETCYELVTHNSTDSVDAQPYEIITGEHYEQFYFTVPWKQGDQGTRYGSKLDNKAVLHHWLLFTTASAPNAGFHETVIGTQIGDAATLLAGWAVGGTNLALQDDVAFELPPPGTMLNLQWHFFNSTGQMQKDHSAVQVCTVPAGTRPHTASITWLGSEDLGGNKFLGGQGMPSHKMSSYSGTCDPLREGMNESEPIHILGFWPHMHKYGVQMQSFVNHSNGMKEKIFDKPFDFNFQIHYLQKYELMPGDTITATCTYNNTSDHGVPFGESTEDEMCYQFTFSYPAHSLENHVFSFIGATNTCW